MPYEFHTDPGHGWLAVQEIELTLVGVADQISAFSYQRDGVVYLEEDGDMAKFLEAKLAMGYKPLEERRKAYAEWWKAHVKEVDHASDCFVRRLARYQGR